jgi:hypothetical protein
MPECLMPRDRRRRLDGLQEHFLNLAGVARDCATNRKARLSRRSIAVRIRRTIALWRTVPALRLCEFTSSDTIMPTLTNLLTRGSHHTI